MRIAGLRTSKKDIVLDFPSALPGNACGFFDLTSINGHSHLGGFFTWWLVKKKIN